MEKDYSPNHIPITLRFLCVIWVICLAFYGWVELAIGYTYIPSKHGSAFFVSGFPTLLIAFAAFLWAVAALLTLIDHYDKRNNEEDYKFFRKACWWTGLFFFWIAPLTEFWIQVYPQSVQSFFYRVHGFAEHYTLYKVDYKQYLPHITHYKNLAVKGLVASSIIFIFTYFPAQSFPNILGRIAAFSLYLLLLCLSISIFSFTLEDFCAGEISYGRSTNKHIVQAISEPAKFNAYLLTHFMICSLMILICILGGIGVLTNRIKNVKL